ncbi:MAG: hypothetical protein Q8P65_00215 [bacterium]|nr:hypothetical protein [bacterium]
MKLDLQSETLKIIKPMLAQNSSPVVLKRVDDILLWLEDDQENKNILEHKSRGLISNRKQLQTDDDNTASRRTKEGLNRDDRIVDFCCEIFSANWLRQNGFIEIKIIDEVKSPGSPDFSAKKNDAIYYCESKFYHRSLLDRDKLSLSPDGYCHTEIRSLEEVNSIKQNIKPVLCRKLDLILSDCEKKFKNIVKVDFKNTIVCLGFELETGIISSLDNDKRELPQILEDINFDEMAKHRNIGKIVFLPSNLFNHDYDII